jgi:hypothetical protein
LDATTYELFVENLQIKEEENEKINKFLPTNKLRSIEFALKVSNNTIVPNNGLGRVVLTQKWYSFHIKFSSKNHKNSY